MHSLHINLLISILILNILLTLYCINNINIDSYMINLYINIFNLFDLF